MASSCHKQTLARTCKGPTKVRQPAVTDSMAEPEDFADQVLSRDARTSDALAAPMRAWDGNAQMRAAGPVCEEEK
ncbi:hypothetical protein MGG_17272 [Pyricularia oryzae 70-15]|uniref:Uncharacterized protein n=1 Tax=Pyricularia oryzae (strain 70-15 / ATCC MYA-4617 / FGSC 8958) TaxID=242507 RepID=G4NA31_PYRO7|nr:uncharacterized protein MGG_17272 [Pyricularia oryzae 70-15]EHA51277.1 hypothetical protein MGG_17272 [Pyricularia oryzae 70-15]